LQRLYDLQQKASTGKAYATASENPAVAAQGISLRSTQNQIAVYQNTMAATKTWLDTNDQALTQMTSILKNAQSTILQALNGAQGPEEHKVAAITIDGYIQQLIDVGNSSDTGRFVFSGLKTDTKPFVMMSGSAGAVVDQIPVNMSITAASGSLLLNTFNVNYQLGTNPNELLVDGHKIDINAKYLPDTSVNPDYPTYTVDGQAIVPNTSGSLNFEGLQIYGNTDSASTPPVFTVNGKGISTTATSGSNFTTPGSFSIVYNPATGSLIANGGLDTPVPVTGDPNSYYVKGVKITVDSSGSPAVYYVDGQTVSTGTNGYTYLNDVTLHSGSAFDLPPVGGISFGGLVSGSATLMHDYVKYQGDGNVITRSIAPSQSMTIGINGGATMNPVGGMFDTLIKLRDLLNSEDYVSPHDVSGSAIGYQVAQQVGQTQSAVSHATTALVNQEPSVNFLSLAYGQLLQVTNSVSQQLSVNGTRLQNLQDAVDRADKASYEITSQLSQNESVNMAEAISDVNNQTTVYQAVINMSAKVQNTLNLFDKL
jgi:flagellar hook-associated protein 3 FlgL